MVSALVYRLETYYGMSKCYKVKIMLKTKW